MSIQKRRELIGDPVNMAIASASLLERPGGLRERARRAVFRGDTNPKEYQSLCNDLNNHLYKKELYELGIELGLPLTKRNTKEEICNMLAEIVSSSVIEAPKSIDTMAAESRYQRTNFTVSPPLAARLKECMRNDGDLLNWYSVLYESNIIPLEQILTSQKWKNSIGPENWEQLKQHWFQRAKAIDGDRPVVESGIFSNPERAFERYFPAFFRRYLLPDYPQIFRLIPDDIVYDFLLDSLEDIRRTDKYCNNWDMDNDPREIMKIHQAIKNGYLNIFDYAFPQDSYDPDPDRFEDPDLIEDYDERDELKKERDRRKQRRQDRRRFVGILTDKDEDEDF